MKKTFKKTIASIMSVVSLAMCVTGMSASASSATVTDSYSKFYYYRNTTDCGCTLTNLSGSPRYAQVSMTVYTNYGTYFPGNYDPALPNGSSVSCSYSGYVVTGVEFYGTLYFNTTPYGTPLSSWHKSL
ncbi:hypothetical protein [Ruminococcus flavefaciens]|uniref:hypothetical protein n=1 Tax=Ruminococcus flavefaciens TaxID=1265 RepID=UPI001146FA84|nr:hypothetical protein [Ruminococcus flavefaciens]